MSGGGQGSAGSRSTDLVNEVSDAGDYKATAFAAGEAGGEVRERRVERRALKRPAWRVGQEPVRENRRRSSW